MTTLTLFIFALIAYMLGSIPFGLYLTRYFTRTDLREIGSGNIGATNVLRTGKKGIAAATLLLDALKGTVSVEIAAFFSPLSERLDALCIASFFAIVGHCYSFLLKFQGGKGVATAFGVLAVIAPRVMICAALIWVGMVKLSHISSLGGLSAFIAMPVLFWLLYPAAPWKGEILLTILVISALVIWRHKDNIKRLCRGDER